MSQAELASRGRNRPALRLVETKDLSRDEWLSVRKNGIGGSDAAAAVGLSPYMSPLELWLIKTGRDANLRRPNPDDTTEPVYWGTLLEPIVAASYTKQTGNKVRRVNAVLQHPTIAFMLANVDREIVGNRDVQLLECKTAGKFGVHLWRVDVLSGLAFAAVLEGVACLLWTVALRPPLLPAPGPAVTEAIPTNAPPFTNFTVMPQREVTASHVDQTVGCEAVTRDRTTVTGGHAPRGDPVTPLPSESSPDDEMTRLVRDIAAGHLRPTVADIRRYLGCSQARAAALRRELAERSLTV
ncbi:endonuclease [Caballeronia telluris]|uniref:Endonuclease n=1 Tax=Caballeronia telluris TaxID=326475 RepID=A0A158FIN7_9BURK|nr:YqaJ viral recombinase family protein [Caballeronia telluris]SAL19796.1 endonuclease [Caballeronia telluris]